MGVASSSPERPSTAPAASSQAPLSPEQNAAAIAALQESVTTISSLEEHHRVLLERLTQKRLDLQAAQSSIKDSIEAQTVGFEAEIEQLKKDNKVSYEAEMEKLNNSKDEELENMVQHINTTSLEERRTMMYEDVRAYIARELYTAWDEGVKIMKEQFHNDTKTEMTITKETYKKKFAEFQANLDEEYETALAAHQQKIQRLKKKRNSQSFLEWFSPTKRLKEESDEDDADDSIDIED